MPELYLPSLFLTSLQKGRGERTIEVNLNRGLFFPELERIYCSVSQAVLPYSIVNISKDIYNNATINVNGVDFVIPEGSYLSLTELNQAVQAVTGQTGIIITANTSTNQVILTVPAGVTVILSPNLSNELGFPPNTTIIGPISSLSTQPVLFNDIISSGILVTCELDLQVTTFFNQFDNANILCQIPIHNTDIPGGTIIFPRDVLALQCPLINNKSIKLFRLRFVSPRDPQRDLIFLQGDVSIVLAFTAVY